jgi:hypothetical protein
LSRVKNVGKTWKFHIYKWSILWTEFCLFNFQDFYLVVRFCDFFTAAMSASQSPQLGRLNLDKSKFLSIFKYCTFKLMFTVYCICSIVIYEGGDVVLQARSLWRLELARTKWAGGFINWLHPMRIRHITTGRYLGVNENLELCLLSR